MPRKGIPIGNLTSQIFANIYLNELDRFVANTIKPLGYIRYGDDFLIIDKSRSDVLEYREAVINFLRENLDLSINPKNDIIIKARQGVHFLGIRIFPKGRKLNKRNIGRIKSRLTLRNVSSYSGLIKQHTESKRVKEFHWRVLQKLEEEI